MPITKINSYDPDEVFKQKCNENFSNINARVVSCSRSSFEAVLPVGSIVFTTNMEDERLRIGQWQKLDADLRSGVYMYERIS